MNKVVRILVFGMVGVLLPAAFAWAHVPYLEESDFTDETPFEVPKSIEQSIAAYAWLEFEGEDFDSDDIDPYVFTLTEPAEVYIEVLVPACHGYETFAPWFAITGPGLPDPTENFPFEIDPGDGIIVMPNEPTDPRDTFYEPFGGKTYYEGPTFVQTIDEPGDYRIYYWDPSMKGGDYVAVIGNKEIWELDDIIRGLVETLKIRKDEELHLVCEPPVDVDDDDSSDDDDDSSDDDDFADDDDSDDDTTPPDEDDDELDDDPSLPSGDDDSEEDSGCGC